MPFRAATSTPGRASRQIPVESSARFGVGPGVVLIPRWSRTLDDSKENGNLSRSWELTPSEIGMASVRQVVTAMVSNSTPTASPLDARALVTLSWLGDCRATL